MSNSQMFKMTGEVILSTISNKDLNGDFLFMDRRTGKTFQFFSETRNYSETSVVTVNKTQFQASMTNNSNFLKITSFCKDGKIENAYEPKVVTMVTHDTKIMYYVSDSNLDSSGWWVDVKTMSNGIPNAHKNGNTVNQITQLVPDLHVSPEEASVQLEGISSHRICEIWHSGDLKFSDHRFV